MPPDSTPLPDFAGTDLAGLACVRKIGEGYRSTVYHVRWRGRDAALKLYKPEAIAGHARKVDVPLAEFEYQRNLRLYQAKGLTKFIAEPLARVVRPDVQAFLQERLTGELYYFYHRFRRGAVPRTLVADLARLVGHAHAAGLYDLDLHALNIMVVENAPGQVTPKLFDFNLIPFTVRPPNPVIGWLLKTGVLHPEWRDRRRLRNLDRFAYAEKRMSSFYRTG